MNFSRHIVRLFRGVSFDVWGAASVFLVLVFLQRDLWITGERVLTHDSLKWYPIFAYFADCLQQGQLPLWNPYMHCGEPFFPNIAILHLWDPITLFLVLWGKIFHVATFTLYRYDLLIRYFVFCLGGYVFFRSVARHRLSAFFAFFVLVFSSLSSSYLRQHGFVLLWYLFPWIVFFLTDFLERRRSASLLALAFCLGIALTSAHSMFIFVACLVFSASLLAWRGIQPQPVGMRWSAVLAAGLIFILITLVVIPLGLTYAHDIVPTVRMTQVMQAAFSHAADFLVLFAPYAFILHFFNWEYISESFLYIGLLPFLFFLTGVIFSRHRYKKTFLTSALLLISLMLGDSAFLYPLFSKVLPFFSTIRNMHLFSPLLIFFFVYFVCVGVDEFIEKKAFADAPFRFFFLCGFVAACAFGVKLYFDRSWVKAMSILHIFQEIPSVLTKKHILLILDMLALSSINVIFFLCACLLLYLLVRRGGVPVKLLAAGLVFAAFFDLTLFQWATFQVVTAPASSVEAPQPPAAVSWDEKRIAVFSQSPNFGMMPLLYRQFAARGVSGELLRWFSFPLPVDGLMRDALFLLAAVTPSHFFQTRAFFDFETNTNIPDTVKQQVMGVSAPRLRFARAVILPREEIAAAMRSRDPQAPAAIFIEREPSMGAEWLAAAQRETGGEGGVPAAWHVSSFGPNHLEVEVRSASGGFLYYADTYDKHWKAYVDGKRRRLDKANLAFKAVFVEEGRHRVRFVYDPVLYKAALGCYFCGLLAFPIVFSFFKRAEGK